MAPAASLLNVGLQGDGVQLYNSDFQNDQILVADGSGARPAWMGGHTLTTSNSGDTVYTSAAQVRTKADY